MKPLILVIVILLTISGILLYQKHIHKSSVTSVSSDAQKRYFCDRNQRYDNPPEFDRVLSLIDQRIREKGTHKEQDFLKIIPCISVKYADIKSIGGNAEGYFLFGGPGISYNYLPVYVDNSYHEVDDLVTAFLLVHEMTHAYQYTLSLNNANKFDCYKKEEQAFSNQMAFLGYLNKEEFTALYARASFPQDKQSQIQLIRYFFQYHSDAINYCSSTQDNESCISEFDNNQISLMVRQNPVYQKLCGTKS